MVGAAEKSPEPPLEAYCINLRERRDRWRQVQRAFRGTDVHLKRIDGVKATPGWIGCGRSFQKIVRIAKRRGLPWVLVIEDDAVPTPSFQQHWPKVRAALWEARDTWELFSSGVTHLKDSRITPRADGILIGYDHGYSTQFHIVNAKVYDKVLAWNPPCHGEQKDWAIDVYYSKEFKKVTTHPMLTVQRPSYSNIERMKKDYTRSFRKNSRLLFAALRKTRKRRRRD